MEGNGHVEALNEVRVWVWVGLVNGRGYTGMSMNDSAC